ncbi:hypothetical protein CCACVL1_27480, partial [Corchorus capsularis]
EDKEAVMFSKSIPQGNREPHVRK